ncbi:MAG TPA: phage tail protein [Candidatus Nanoarchaeia archaeon]|nr:phage tail protein [Candidatus Nanoarchaeia archaeon]
MSFKNLRLDPYAAYNFIIEIEGIIAGGFSEVSGLKIETEVESIREGGANDVEYKLPKGTKYSNITLKRGITDFDLIWRWYDDVINGKIKRKNGLIVLYDQAGLALVIWGFVDAYPIMLDGPSLNATSNTIATQTLTLAHHGLKRVV